MLKQQCKIGPKFWSYIHHSQVINTGIEFFFKVMCLKMWKFEFFVESRVWCSISGLIVLCGCSQCDLIWLITWLSGGDQQVVTESLGNFLIGSLSPSHRWQLTSSVLYGEKGLRFRGILGSVWCWGHYGFWFVVDLGEVSFLWLMGDCFRTRFVSDRPSVVFKSDE